MAELRIYMFGGLRLEKSGRALPAFPTAKVRALFAYLVAFRRRAHPRSVLAGLLWPEEPDERARRYLSDALWRTRSVVGPGNVIAVDDTLQFAPGVQYWLDVGEFEARIEERSDALPDSAALQEAVRLVRGPFLEGFYEDWALRERERLQIAYLEALDRLLVHFREQGNLEAALDYGLQLAGADPLRESAHRQVMLLYQRLGRPHAALGQYETCLRVLREELETDPLPETTHLYNEIVASLSPRRSPFDDFGRAPLVGRADERAALMARLEAAQSGRGSLLLIEGPAGAGKTRLVEELAASAGWRGFQVLSGKCRMQPYDALVEALALTPLRANQLARLLRPDIRAALAPLLPALSDPEAPASSSGEDTDADVKRLHQGLAECLAALGRISPHLLVLEDWQWMDASLLEALVSLAGRLATSRVLLVGTARSGELRDRSQAWEGVLELDRGGQLERLTLAPMGRSESDDLIKQLLGLVQPLPELFERLYECTRGNALFIIEWLKSLVESEELIRSPSGDWKVVEIPGWRAPKAVQRVIASRLECLQPDKRQLLQSAAVLGDSFSFDLWRQAAGVSDEAMFIASDDLLRRQFIIETPCAYRFSHDLIRQVSYDSLDPAERRQLHSHAGKALQAQSPDDAPALAYHFESAGDGRQAFGYHLLAAERARSLYANQAALYHYGHALNLGASLDLHEAGRQMAAALCQRAEVHILSGDYPTAEADYRSALELAQRLPDDRSTLVRALHGLGWLRGYYLEQRAEGLAILSQARDLYAAEENTAELAQIISQCGHILTLESRWDEAIAVYHQAQTLAAKSGNRRAQARCLYGIGVARMFLGCPALAASDLEAGASLYQELGDRRWQSKCLANAGQSRLQIPDFAGASAAFHQAWQINEEIGALTSQPFIQIGLAFAAWSSGNLDEARQVVQDGLARCQALGSADSVEAMMRANLARVQRDSGEIHAALDSLAITLELARIANLSTAVYALFSLAELRMLLGDLIGAAPLAGEALDLARQIDYPAGEMGAYIILGRLALLQREPDTARRHLQAAARLGREVGGWYECGQQRLALADYWIAVKRPDRALALARRTTRQAAAQGTIVLHSQALCALAHGWLALGRPHKAINAAAQALAQAEEHNLRLVRFQAAIAIAQAQSGSDPEGARQHFQQALEIVQEIASQLSDSHLRRIFLVKPEVAGIQAHLEDLRRRHGRQQLVHLARLDGLAGRVQVRWTLDAGRSDSVILESCGKVALRQARLLRLLEQARSQGGLPTQEELAQVLQAGLRTVRADLATLRRQGHLVETRGSGRTRS